MLYRLSYDPENLPIKKAHPDLDEPLQTLSRKLFYQFVKNPSCDIPTAISPAIVSMPAVGAVIGVTYRVFIIEP
jgi:hypothetical protein